MVEKVRADIKAAEDAAARHCKQWHVLNVRSYDMTRTHTTGVGGVAELFIKLAGGIDVATEAGLPDHADLEPEAIGQLNAEVIFGLERWWVDGKDGVAHHQALPGVGETPAAKEGRIIPVQNLSIHPSWRMPGHAAEIAEALAGLPC